VHRLGRAARSAARTAIAARRAASRGTPFTLRSSRQANDTDTPAIPAARFGVTPDPTRSSSTRCRSADTLPAPINAIPFTDQALQQSPEPTVL
jgi:hypothetical protein